VEELTLGYGGDRVRLDAVRSAFGELTAKTYELLPEDERAEGERTTLVFRGLRTSRSQGDL
jgi:hypothetical protein